MAILEPWVMLRLIAGVVSLALFARASITSARVLRHFNVSRASEGQLALERRVELARTFVRVGAAVQVASLVLTMLAADKLSHGVRGAMCAYGVFRANEWGFPALAMSASAAVAAGVLLQLFALDGKVRGLDLVKPLSWATLVVAPLVAADLFLSARFLFGLDLGVVASCCSVELDPGAATTAGYAQGPRILAAGGAVVSIIACIGVSWLASRRPRAGLVVLAGALGALALPFALGASVLEVAPHVFETPHHRCPFCLLHGDVMGIGYVLYGAMFLAMVWGLGAALAALTARGEAARAAFGAFARGRMRAEAVAWSIALAVGVLPVVRYVIVANGASLFR